MDQDYKSKYMQVLEEALQLHKKIGTLEKQLQEKDLLIEQLKHERNLVEDLKNEEREINHIPEESAESTMISSSSFSSITQVPVPPAVRLKPMEDLKAEISLLGTLRKYPTIAPAPSNVLYSSSGLFSKSRIASKSRSISSTDTSNIISDVEFKVNGPKRTLSNIPDSPPSKRSGPSLCAKCKHRITKDYHTFTGRGVRICKFPVDHTAIAAAALIGLNTGEPEAPSNGTHVTFIDNTTPDYIAPDETADNSKTHDHLLDSKDSRVQLSEQYSEPLLLPSLTQAIVNGIKGIL